SAVRRTGLLILESGFGPFQISPFLIVQLLTSKEPLSKLPGTVEVNFVLAGMGERKGQKQTTGQHRDQNETYAERMARHRHKHRKDLSESPEKSCLPAENTAALTCWTGTATI